MRIPVYLFVGFIESGKTKFVQELLAGDDFNSGERTLLLLCEEGVEAYDEKKFFAPNIFIEKISSEGELTPQNLGWLQRKHRVERIIVEYNGMWLLEKLMSAMPVEWETAQMITFFNGESFLSYNTNMRQLIFDKMVGTDMVVFNRCNRDTIDKEQLRKIVRGASRTSMILYEYDYGDVESDDTPVELPYDMTKNTLEIEDKYFAEWYRDLNENLNAYENKKVIVKGRAVIGGDLPAQYFIFGRHLMTCCVDDISFAGILVKADNPPVLHGRWYLLEGVIHVEQAEPYGKEPGPVIYFEKAEPAPPAVPEVAAFY